LGSTLPTQAGEQREDDVDVILEIWEIEPTFFTQSGARKMVVLSLYDTISLFDYDTISPNDYDSSFLRRMITILFRH